MANKKIDEYVKTACAIKNFFENDICDFWLVEGKTNFVVMSCVQKGHIIIFTTSKCKNCACYEYKREMEGFLLPEIDGIKKITEHKLSTVCGQVLKHVKKSYRTLYLKVSFGSLSKKKNIWRKLFFSCRVININKQLYYWRESWKCQIHL